MGPLILPLGLGLLFLASRSSSASSSSPSMDADALKAAKLADGSPDTPKPGPRPKPSPRPGPGPGIPAPGAPKPAAAGADRTKAARVAPDLARHLSQKKYDYSRKVLSEWQRLAGLPQDGLYGPETAAALRVYAPQAPKPFFKGRK